MRVSFHINNPYIGDFIGLSMKIMLTLIMCSFTNGTCIAPYTVPEAYDNMYDCLMSGYKMSLEKTTEIGPEKVNEHGIYIKFHCKQVPEA